MSSAESDSYQPESSRSENLFDIWSNDGEEIGQELNENFCVLFAFEPKAPISSTESSMQPDDVGLEEEVEETIDDRTSNLYW